MGVGSVTASCHGCQLGIDAAFSDLEWENDDAMWRSFAIWLTPDARHAEGVPTEARRTP
jgi:hypothetical protein